MYVASFRGPGDTGGSCAELGCEVAAVGWICQWGIRYQGCGRGEFFLSFSWAGSGEWSGVVKRAGQGRGEWCFLYS